MVETLRDLPKTVILVLARLKDGSNNPPEIIQTIEEKEIQKMDSDIEEEEEEEEMTQTTEHNNDQTNNKHHMVSTEILNMAVRQESNKSKTEIIDTQTGNTQTNTQTTHQIIEEHIVETSNSDSSSTHSSDTASNDQIIQSVQNEQKQQKMSNDSSYRKMDNVMEDDYPVQASKPIIESMVSLANSEEDENLMKDENNISPQSKTSNNKKNMLKQMATISVYSSDEEEIDTQRENNQNKRSKKGSKDVEVASTGVASTANRSRVSEEGNIRPSEIFGKINQKEKQQNNANTTQEMSESIFSDAKTSTFANNTTSSPTKIEKMLNESTGYDSPDIKNVTIVKSPNSGLGFAISERILDDGTGLNKAFIIQSVVPGGPASECKDIEPGDQLFSVESHVLGKQSLREVVGILKELKAGLIGLKIRKQPAIIKRKYK